MRSIGEIKSEDYEIDECPHHLKCSSRFSKNSFWIMSLWNLRLLAFWLFVRKENKNRIWINFKVQIFMAKKNYENIVKWDRT